jgi:hypothetical protein
MSVRLREAYAWLLEQDQLAAQPQVDDRCGCREHHRRGHGHYLSLAMINGFREEARW